VAATPLRPTSRKTTINTVLNGITERNLGI
jgi:hypothetical protein